MITVSDWVSGLEFRDQGIELKGLGIELKGLGDFDCWLCTAATLFIVASLLVVLEACGSL